MGMAKKSMLQKNNWMAAQPIKTNNIKAMIDKTEETVNVECVEKLKRE